MTNWLRDAAPLAVAAILIGTLAPLLPVQGLIVLVGALMLWLAIILVGLHAGEGAGGVGGAWHPGLMVLAGLAVFTVTWNGVRPGGLSPPDLLLIAALGAVIFCWVQDSVRVPIPGWLVGAAVGLFAAQMIARFFVPLPPLDPPPVFTPPGSPFVTLARFELGFLVVPIVIGAVASSWQRANLIANLWVIGATISATVAMFDSVTGAGIGASITGFEYGNRAAGLAIHPNHLALPCAMALPIALLRAVQLEGKGRAAAIVATGVLGAGILASGSRVGLFAALLAVGLMGLLISKLRSRILAVGLGAAVLLLLTVSLVPDGNSLFIGIDRLAGGEDSSLADGQRADQLRESVAILKDHPVTGVGFQTIADAHSLPIQFWEAGGLLGLLSMLLYVTGVLGTGFTLLRDRSLSEEISTLAGAMTVSFSVWLIAGLLQNQIADRYIYMPVGLLLGLAVAANAWRAASAQSEPRSGAPPARDPVPVPKRVEQVPA